MLLTEKSPEAFPKHKGHFFVSESFALNWYIFIELPNKKLLRPLQGRLKQNFLFDLEDLIGNGVSLVNVSSNLCFWPKPGIQIFFSLLSICTDELISTPKIMTFLPLLPSGNENSERDSNPIP